MATRGWLAIKDKHLCWATEDTLYTKPETITTYYALRKSYQDDKGLFDNVPAYYQDGVVTVPSVAFGVTFPLSGSQKPMCNDSRPLTPPRKRKGYKVEYQWGKWNYVPC